MLRQTLELSLSRLRKYTFSDPGRCCHLLSILNTNGAPGFKKEERNPTPKKKARLICKDWQPAFLLLEFLL